VDFSFTEEQQLFRASVRDWVESNYPKERALELEAREYEYPFELWDDLGKAGLHGVGIPEEYGGQGGDIITQMIVARELSRSLAGLSWVWGLSSFAGGKSVGLFGTDEQKQELLPGIAKGELKFAIAVTEPGGGTDLLGALATTAEKVEGGWRINGQKIWSTQAHVADYILLLARSDKNVEKKTLGTTLFLVPGDAPGIETRQIPKIGMRSVGSCEVFLDDVFVPDNLVLGEVGRAWYQLLGTLNNERIMVASLSLGALDGVIEEALRYVMEREAFGKPIGQFQRIQHYIADMLISQQCAELLTFKAAWLQSTGQPCGMEANMAKIVASDAAVQGADWGIQMFGGMGYSLETQMQRYWRDARLWRIGPVTNEMGRNVIAEMAGLPRSF
jgi:acyl-CoA dehydrogenase